MIEGITEFLHKTLNFQPKLQIPKTSDKGFLCFNCGPYRTENKSVQEIASECSELINGNLDKFPLIEKATPEGPFVNLKINHVQFLSQPPTFKNKSNPQKILLEFSSPNTNKPQHLGHVRNNVLGVALANILKSGGHDVQKVNLINDRGIHIMKSLLAYKKWGCLDSNKKGDHFVGDCYVRFNKELKEEHKEYKISTGIEISEEDFFNQHSTLGKEAKELLLLWESGDKDTLDLWGHLNSLVLKGFKETYDRLGVRFDQIDYESNTYLLGKKAVEEGLNKGIFYYKEGAVVFDQTQVGLQGEKIILRSDGTSLYVTQDLGTALYRLDTYKPDQMFYVVGDEQNHYFKTLIGILTLLRPELTGKVHHISYGMVELPNGKMKSREGNVVDADNLMDEMYSRALEKTKNKEFDKNTYETIGLCALKYYLLDHHPDSKITFDYDKSLDFTGRTGVYILYTYARCQKILAKATSTQDPDYSLLTEDTEKKLVQQIALFDIYFNWALENKDPSKITEYLWKLSKNISQFYESCPVLQPTQPGLSKARLALVSLSAQTLKEGLKLLGCNTLDEM